MYSPWFKSGNDAAAQFSGSSYQHKPEKWEATISQVGRLETWRTHDFHKHSSLGGWGNKYQIMALHPEEAWHVVSKIKTLQILLGPATTKICRLSKPHADCEQDSTSHCKLRRISDMIFILRSRGIAVTSCHLSCRSWTYSSVKNCKFALAAGEPEGMGHRQHALCT